MLPNRSETQITSVETYIDEGPKGYAAGKNDITRQDTGQIDPRLIANIPGANGEHTFFANGNTGRMTNKEWIMFKTDLRANGMQYPTTIFKEIDGTVHVWEGNHRRAAALEMHMEQVPVEVRYFGNSQRQGLVI